MEVSYGIAHFTYQMLKEFEDKGYRLGGIVQDWKEIIDEHDSQILNKTNVGSKSMIECKNCNIEVEKEGDWCKHCTEVFCDE